MNANEKLAEYRNVIDALDEEILSRLNERAEVAGRIGRLKTDEGLEFYAPDREEQIVLRLVKLNKGRLTEAAIRAIFGEVCRFMLTLQQPETPLDDTDEKVWHKEKYGDFVLLKQGNKTLMCVKSGDAGHFDLMINEHNAAIKSTLP